MGRTFNRRRRRGGERGVMLLEILIAISLLGIGFVAIFSGFSTAMQSLAHADRYEQATDFAANKLNALEVDPGLEPGEVLSGVTNSGLSWEASTRVADQRPGSDPDHPVQLMRIHLRVFWKTPTGEQGFTLETLKIRIPPPPAGS